MIGMLTTYPHLRQDFAASLVVFLVALPLCVGVAVASGVPAELGLVTVDPDARRIEHGTEGRAVDRRRPREEFAQRRGLERIVGPARRLTRLGEQPQADAQIAISATPSLMTASPAGFVVSNA